MNGQNLELKNDKKRKEEQLKKTQILNGINITHMTRATNKTNLTKMTHSNQFKNISRYNPYKDNDVLNVTYTTFNAIMLIRNGTCVSWGSNKSTLGRKCVNSLADAYVPHPINFPTKIVEIACGRNHCLARGDNSRIYSWGCNTFGQLGLSGFPMAIGSEKDVPCEISTFMNIKIKQISASGNSSFAITEGGNNLYGWGDNQNGQLGLNWQRWEKVPSPRLIEITDKFLNEFFICQNKNGTKTLVAELFRPTSKVSQAMIFYNNKRLQSKEIELISEKEKLEFQLEQMNNQKNFSFQANDQQNLDQLLDDVNSFINFFQSKNKSNSQGDKHKLDKKVFNKKNSNNGENSPFEFGLNPGNKKKSVIQKSEDIKKLYDILKIDKLFAEDDLGHSKPDDLIQLLFEVRDKIKNTNGKKLVRESIGDYRSVMERLTNDQSVLKNCCFNPDSEYLSESILKSDECLENLEAKINSYNVDQSNVIGSNAIEIMKNNISMSKMNNVLLEKILFYSKLYYNKSSGNINMKENYCVQVADLKDKITEEKQRVKELQKLKIRNIYKRGLINAEVIKHIYKGDASVLKNPEYLETNTEKKDLLYNGNYLTINYSKACYNFSSLLGLGIWYCSYRFLKTSALTKYFHNRVFQMNIAALLIGIFSRNLFNNKFVTSSPSVKKLDQDKL